MGKARLDLANSTNAESSRNKTALIGVTIMNAVICVAYVVEVLKGARSIGSFAILAMICIVSIAVAMGIYVRRKDSYLIRSILGYGFLIFYGYIMFTSKTDMPFCYVLVAVSILLVYGDYSFQRFSVPLRLSSI